MASPQTPTTLTPNTLTPSTLSPNTLTRNTRTPKTRTPKTPTTKTYTPKTETVKSSNASSTPPRLTKSGLSKPTSKIQELVSPGIISDEDFADCRYGEGELSVLNRPKRTRRLRTRSKVEKGGPKLDNGVRTWSTEARFLQQRAASTQYAKRNGEPPPGYAFMPPELNENWEVIPKKERTQAEIDKDYGDVLEQSRNDYDKAYERNVHEVEHGPRCACNTGQWQNYPRQPTWTVTAGVLSQCQDQARVIQS